MAKVLIGISNGRGKESNNPFYCLGYIEPCDSIDNKYGSFGKKYNRVFVPEELYSRVTPDDLGKEIIFDYEIRGDRARVVDFRIVSDSASASAPSKSSK